MMWMRNLRTVYFIIWTFLAPSKLCISTKLGLEDSPSIYITTDIIIIDDPLGPFQPRPFCDHRTWLVEMFISLMLVSLFKMMRGKLWLTSNRAVTWVTLHKWQEDMLLLASLLTSTCIFFFIKRYGSFLVCTFSHPHPLHLGEEGVRGKTKMVCNDLSRRSFTSALFSSVRDGSDAGGEIALLFLLRPLSGRLRDEKVNKPNWALFTPEKIWVALSIETRNIYQIYQAT